MTSTPSLPTKATILQKVWKNFYDRLKDNVSSVTITGSTTVTIQNYTNAFPENKLDEKGDYPALIVNSPDMSWERLTFGKKTAVGTITVDIYTTQAESADKFLDAIIESIETYRDDLKGDACMFNVNVESTSSDSAIRGAFTVHLRSVTFNWNFQFTETRV